MMEFMILEAFILFSEQCLTNAVNQSHSRGSTLTGRLIWPLHSQLRIHIRGQGFAFVKVHDLDPRIRDNPVLFAKKGLTNPAQLHFVIVCTTSQSRCRIFSSPCLKLKVRIQKEAFTPTHIQQTSQNALEKVFKWIFRIHSRPNIRKSYMLLRFY